MPDLSYHACAPDDVDGMMSVATDWDVVRQLGRFAWPADPEQMRGIGKAGMSAQTPCHVSFLPAAPRRLGAYARCPLRSHLNSITRNETRLLKA